jgi:hypothetical protein
MPERLLIKSDESLRVSEECVGYAAYNSGISRAYYSIFQTIKSTCEIKSLDVSSFIINGNYPHNSIGRIFCSLMENKMGNFDYYKSEIYSIANEIVKVYKKREVSDYFYRSYEKPDLEEAIRTAKKVKDWIKRI